MITRADALSAGLCCFEVAGRTPAPRPHGPRRSAGPPRRAVPDEAREDDPGDGAAQLDLMR